MRLKLLIVALLLCIGYNSNAQRNINKYKYVLVPDFYDFLKNEDQYQLNSLTKFLFNKYGFQAYIEGDNYPDGLLPKACNILYADVINDSKFLTTVLRVSLSDCEGNIVYISGKGRSKEKDYKKSYHEALRKAFISIQELNYAYSPEDDTEEVSKSPITTSIEDKADELKSKEKPSSVLSKTTKIDTIDKEITIYTSANSTYRIHQTASGFIVYDGNEKIGSAKEETSTGKFLIQTTAFNGVGRIEGSYFIIERSIKGVDGVVKMLFIKN